MSVSLSTDTSLHWHSPVFKDMMSLPQSRASQAEMEERPSSKMEVLELPETSAVLETLLSCCDPSVQPKLSKIDRAVLFSTFEVGLRYQIGCIPSMLLPHIESLVPLYPLQIYAIGAQTLPAACGDSDLVQDLLAVLRSSAKQLLKYKIPFTQSLSQPSEFASLLRTSWKSCISIMRTVGPKLLDCYRISSGVSARPCPYYIPNPALAPNGRRRTSLFVTRTIYRCLTPLLGRKCYESDIGGRRIYLTCQRTCDKLLEWLFSTFTTDLTFRRTASSN
jgi:hypothetical protein